MPKQQDGQFHRFAKLLFFGGEGVDHAENIRHEQRKIIKYNHLVANMVILHNVVDMTHALNQIRREGTVITRQMASISACDWSQSTDLAITHWTSGVRWNQ